MNEKYYTVEQISEMLNIHPKTVQRYIREGLLIANKIGKSWRVSGHDLSVFAEGSKARPEKESRPVIKIEDKVKASSVIDIQVTGKNEADRIINTLVAVMNAKPIEYGKSSMHSQYIEVEERVRITVWGSLKFLSEILGCISIFTDIYEEE